MAKEINPNSPPGVFQLFNENRTFYFESDISSLPNPPTTLPNSVAVSIPLSTVSVVSPSKSWKSLSQPNLSVVSSSSATAPKHNPVLTPANLHIPAAIMAPTTTHTHLHSHHPHHHYSVSHTGGGEGHYNTDPSYHSSGILRSFKHELHLFHKKSPLQKSHSNPSTPRRGSSPDLLVGIPPDEQDENRTRANSDPRKLSLVPEEPAGQRDRSDSKVAVVAASESVDEVDRASFYIEKPSRPLSVDTARKQRAPSPALELTRRVKDWLVTSHPEVEVSKQELNAFSPSSF